MIFLKDGLYRVCNKYLCAGFIIKDPRVIRYAPILKKKIEYWKQIAVRISDG